MSTLVDTPCRADGVDVLGEAVGSGYRRPPALVRRGDGQVLQLTPVLHQVLAAADGTRSCAQIGEVAARVLSRTITGADVHMLVERHLRPLGLVAGPDGAVPALRRANPLLRLSPRFVITNPRTTELLTAPFRRLFHPVVVAIVVAAFVAIVTWVFFEHGLGASAYDAFERPHLLLLVFVVSVLSGGFHEFGHAAAARYGGARPGAMGAGFYLVWPAFYTDVTDSYRLDRIGRLRTDLGGLYFNAIVVVLTFVWWWTTGWEAVLLVVATQVLQMVRQLLPTLRYDGYHVVADLAGVPDLYSRLRPTLLGLLPHRCGSPQNRVLTPWARWVITLWVLLTVPLMVLMALGLVGAVPPLLATAGQAVRRDGAAVGAAWQAGEPLDVAAHMVQLLSLALAVVGTALVAGRMGWRSFRGLARWSHGSPPRRVVAVGLGTALLTGLSWAWWPHPGTYEPIDPGDRGTLAVMKPPAVQEQQNRPPTTFGAVRTAQVQRQLGHPPAVVLPRGGQPPSKDHPAVAMVLVPATGSPAAPLWVFPFDKPELPEKGDNQALAVNTTDGTVAYDIAIALVWADGNEVRNVNEAHAYASCADCAAVALAFQVVLVLDDPQLVVPQNLAVAANYDCQRCISSALAKQLVLSLPGDPTAAQQQALEELWDHVLTYAQTIPTTSLADVDTQLDQFETGIVELLAGEPATASPSATPSPGTSETSTATPSPTATSSPTPTSDPAPAPTTEPTATPTASPTETASPDPSATPTPTQTATPEPTSTSSPTPTPTP